jgi:alpha-L-rhamnosidase
MGQNLAGVARVAIKGARGSEVKLRYGERLYPDGTLDQTEIAKTKVHGTARTQTDIYILKGRAVEVWQPRFVYHGFRYVEMTGFPGRPTLKNLKGEVIHSDVPSVGEFECSNPLLNHIWRNARWSYLSNLQSIPTDCPQREKNGWTGDAHLAAEQAMYNFDSITVYEKWINDLGDEQRTSGELPGIVPTSGWGYQWGNGPAWDSAFLLIPWYLYQYYDDTQTLRDHYDGMRRYVDYLTSRADDGIMSIGLGDWAAAKTKTPKELTATGFYYRDTLIVSKAAGLLGKEEDARRYAALAESIRQSFNRKFFDVKTGLYANGSQTALSCALYEGLVEPGNEDAVLKNLVAEVDRRDGHIDTGILGAKCLLNTLLDHGRVDVAYRIASQRTFPGWGYWIENGATTLYENWDRKGSLNHIMYGDISAWFYKALAGIRVDPEAPGFKHILIKPYIVGNLTSARAVYDSIHGKIVSEWKKAQNGQIFFNVRVPPNTTARIYVPATDLGHVTESNRPTTTVSGPRFERMEAGYAVFEVKAGSYRFSSH